MSQAEHETKTPEENLAKMEHILSGHKKRKTRLGRMLNRARTRLIGATKEAAAAAESGQKDERKETLVRRFAFDVAQLQKEYQNASDKKDWAERMIHSITVDMHTRVKVVIDPCDGKEEEHLELVYSPFSCLKRLKAS